MSKGLSVVLLTMLIVAGIFCFHQYAFAAGISTLDGCPPDQPNCNDSNPPNSNGTRSRPYTPPPPPPPPPLQLEEYPHWVKFSGMTGQVEVRHDGEKTWHLAKLDTHLYQGDHIRTLEDSAAVLNCEDMSTFALKPESEITITEPRASGTMLRLNIIVGDLWAVSYTHLTLPTIYSV